MKRPEYAGERDEEELWRRAQLRREPVRARWYVPGIVLALTLSVPWYWSGEPAIVAGLPLWVWGTLVCSALLSAVTGAAALLHWDDPESEDGDSDSDSDGSGR